MLVSSILRDKGREVLAVAPTATLLEAARLLSANRIGALVVLNARGELAGLLSHGDVVRALAEAEASALTLTMGSCMATNIATCKESDTIAEIMETMTSCRFGHMPVMEKGQVVGIVSTGDVVKSRIAEALRESQALKDFIASK